MTDREQLTANTKGEHMKTYTVTYTVVGSDNSDPEQLKKLIQDGHFSAKNNDVTVTEAITAASQKAYLDYLHSAGVGTYEEFMGLRPTTAL
jgi:hypothetical protein